MAVTNEFQGFLGKKPGIAEKSWPHGLCLLGFLGFIGSSGLLGLVGSILVLFCLCWRALIGLVIVH